MIREAISQAVDRKNLSSDAAHEVMVEMMSGSATPSQMASFMTAMRMKGETEDELVGFASAMREASVHLTSPANAVDLCGTGGDGSGTFNISTVASFVVAACGVPVAKHGNRSVSSKSGSADLLDALGIPHALQPSDVQKCLDSTGFAFIFAPIFHRSMRNVSEPRREVGIRTFFNLLGPLTNPARVSRQLVGVYDPELVKKVASALARLGTSRAMVVHSSGLDEISNIGNTVVAEVEDGKVSEYELSPSDFGLDLVERGDLIGNTPVKNARIAVSVLRGGDSAKSEVVLMNAAAALYLTDVADDLSQSLEIARRAIQSGKAMAKLNEIFEFAREREGRYQSTLNIGQLMDRKIMPDVLRMRCSEMASFAADRIREAPGGSDRLELLDRSLISSPNVLSAISLNRLHSITASEPTNLTASSRGHCSMKDALSRPGVSVICEYKPMAPSATRMVVPPDPSDALSAYVGAGCAAASVLVEPKFFGGSYELFSQIRSMTSLPLLFKDFVVTEEQIESADQLGADAVLLIAAALGSSALDEFIAGCLSRKMEPIVEVSSEEDIRKLSSCGNLDMVSIIGLNSRDLKTMTTDLTRASALRSSIPSGKILVAESGVSSAEDIRALAEFDAVLVGSTLMEADDVATKAEEIVSAGRRAAS